MTPLPTNARENCSRCGELLAAATLAGLCPRCMARLMFSPTPPSALLNCPSPGVLRSLGDYELQAEIARGGMGVVFRARQASLDRAVAVKLMRDGAFATPEDVKRFRGEASAVARLRHPHIVAIHEVGEQ